MKKRKRKTNRKRKRQIIIKTIKSEKGITPTFVCTKGAITAADLLPRWIRHHRSADRNADRNVESKFWVFDPDETFICYRGCLNLNCYLSKKVQKNFLMG